MLEDLRITWSKNSKRFYGQKMLLGNKYLKIDTIFCLTQVSENGIDCTVDHMLCTRRNIGNIQTSQVRKSLNVVLFYHIYNLCRQNSHFLLLNS